MSQNPADGAEHSQAAGLVWHHLILTTYGSWLHGDSRGFRTRHHRQHVEGDYRNPPPAGMYAHIEDRSRLSLTRAPVVLTPGQRPTVGIALRDRLQALGGIVACMAVGGQHAHILVKAPEQQARTWAGLAKQHAWFTLREHGWSGKLWGKRGKEVVIRDRRHQMNVYWYILGHADEGAWVWSCSSRGK